MNQPFSKDAAEYTKKIALPTGRHVDPPTAVRDLLQAWSHQEVSSRRVRIWPKHAATRNTSEASTSSDSGPCAAAQVASLPGVIDLLTERSKRQPLIISDDIDDVFTEYYAKHPNAECLEVFDE
ncbi:MAG: hypothetical protein WBG36_12770 [Ornithinimicrobium sp.]